MYVFVCVVVVLCLYMHLCVCMHVFTARECVWIGVCVCIYAGKYECCTSSKMLRDDCRTYSSKREAGPSKCFTARLRSNRCNSSICRTGLGVPREQVKGFRGQVTGFRGRVREYTVAVNTGNGYSVQMIATHYLGRREHPGVSEHHHGQVVRVGETTRQPQL